jgi:hypothetical protein
MKSKILVLLCSLLCGIVLAGKRPRTQPEKVHQAELIVDGVASLVGPKSFYNRPNGQQDIYKQNCRISIGRVLWPEHSSMTNVIVIPMSILTNWTSSCRDYNNTTGVFFFVSTEALVKEELQHYKFMYGNSLPEGCGELIRSNLYKECSDTTKQWSKLSRFNDWYEPASNTTEIIRLIKELKK